MAYLWTTTVDIQRYLDVESTITVGDGVDGNYSISDSEGMEKGIVNSIKGYLSISLTLPADDSIPDVLKEAAAKLTAAAIGTARMGSSMGNDLTPWTDRLKNEAWSELQRIFVSQVLVGAVAISIPLWQRLILSRLRERTVIPGV